MALRPVIALLRRRLRAASAGLRCTPAEVLALGLLALGAVGVLGLLWLRQRPVPAEGLTLEPTTWTSEQSPSAGASGAAGPDPMGPEAPGAANSSGGPGGPNDRRGTESGGAAGGTGPTATSAPPVRVHVTGQVRRPGVYALSGGARVVDALAAAGGAVPGADLDRLNLAGPVGDGTQVWVPAPGATPPVPATGVPAPGAPGGPDPGGGAGPGETASAPVDLNTADAATLDTLPGVGPVTAAKILERRAEVGRFSTVEELLDIRGIGEGTLEEIADHVTVR